MNFKDAFDKDCSKINVSDELINRTLMAAMTDDDNSHTMDNPHTCLLYTSPSPRDCS